MVRRRGLVHGGGHSRQHCCRSRARLVGRGRSLVRTRKREHPCRLGCYGTGSRTGTWLELDSPASAGTSNQRMVGQGHAEPLGLSVGTGLRTRVTTWFTFSGIWVLVVLAVLGASPAFGAALLGSYWVGRALSVWLAPLAIRDAAATPELVRAVNRQYGLVRLVHVGSLAWIAIVLGVMLLTLTPLS
jgi:hypothetical protein